MDCAGIVDDIAGYVGTPNRFGCSAFGAPVTLAARCAAVRRPESDRVTGSIVFPDSEWEESYFAQLFEPIKIKKPDGSFVERPLGWNLCDARAVPMKNLPDMTIREIVKSSVSITPPDNTPEERAKETLHNLLDANRYWPEWPYP